MPSFSCFHNKLMKEMPFFMIGYMKAASMINPNIRQNLAMILWVCFIIWTPEDQFLGHATRPVAHSVQRLHGTFEPWGCTSTVVLWFYLYRRKFYLQSWLYSECSWLLLLLPWKERHWEKHCGTITQGSDD